MVKLYQLAPEQLVSERPSAGVRDAAAGTITIGSVTFAAHEADDDSLRAFLSAVRTERGLAANAKLAVRASDAEVLAELLGGSAEHIVRNLQRLLGVDEAEAVELGRWMFRRTALAGALAIGVVAGAAGIGPFSSNVPPASAQNISSTGHAAPAPAAPTDPNWAEIGDAAVLYRNQPPG